MIWHGSRAGEPRQAFKWNLKGLTGTQLKTHRCIGYGYPRGKNQHTVLKKRKLTARDL